MSSKEIISELYVTRRGLLAAGSVATLATLAPHSYAWAAGDDKLRIGSIGVGGRGGANTNGVASQHIAAICDTNPAALAAAGKRYTDAKKYTDWRELLEQDGLDAIVCSTADHHHASVSVAAMRKGLHVYCEKPLGHTAWEARLMQDVYNNRKGKIHTQMGTQIHATDNYRRVVELVHSGAVGDILEAHIWCNRSISKINENQIRLPEEPIPEGFDWDAWLGPAADRPYNTAYWKGGNLNWNRRWDFGNGVLGDMGSHLIDLPFWALQLRDPMSVQSEGPEPDGHTCPPWQVVTWKHRGDWIGGVGDPTNAKPPVDVVWYHGPEGMKRRAERLQPMVGDDTDINKWGIGVAFVGNAGVLVADYGKYVLSPSAKFKDFKKPEQTIPKSKGHYNEWLAAIRGEGETLCNFDYSGKLIEHNMLGIAAHRNGGKKLEWDAETFTFNNDANADQYLTKPYREGWELKPEPKKA